MTKEELKQKAEEFAITYGIGDNFNVSEFIDFAVKFAIEELETLEHNKKTVYHLSNCLSDAQEKKITELEKENAELKKRVDNLYNSDCSIQFHEKKLTCTQTVIRYEKNTRNLKKEKAELKDDNKANEWHDLRKNPNNLPNNKRSVWCYYGDGYGKGFYDKDDGGWWIEGHMYCSIIDAWCEPPIFNKE